MANTGNKQAVIAYRISRANGEPVDVNGELISKSGKRQAIALLTGQLNPNPLLYEVQYYYGPGAAILGTPSLEFDPDDCPIGYITVTPSFQVLIADYGTVTLPTADWLTQTWTDGATMGIAWVDIRNRLDTDDVVDNVKVFAKTAGTIRVSFYSVDTLTWIYHEDFTAVVGSNTFTPTYIATEPCYVAIEGITGEMAIIVPGTDETNSYYVNGGVLTTAGGYPFAYTVQVTSITNREVSATVKSSATWNVLSKSAFLEVTPSTAPNGDTVVTVKVLEKDIEGFINFRNTINNQIAQYKILLASNADWVLETGFWRMAGFWYAAEVWEM